jgi:hypothetical protein
LPPLPLQTTVVRMLVPLPLSLSPLLGMLVWRWRILQVPGSLVKWRSNQTLQLLGRIFLKPLLLVVLGLVLVRVRLWLW